MKPSPLSEVDRRSLLKGAAAGIVGAGVAAAVDAPEAQAQDRGALKDPKVVTQSVSFKNGSDTINGFLARPKDARKVGTVIIVPGIFGVTDQIRETTAQVAQAGLAALAIEFYSRAGGPPQTNDFTVLRSFVGENAPDRQIVSDVKAAVEYLRKQEFSNGKFGVTGFCMGGRITLLAAAEVPGINAASPYYGPVKSAAPVQLSPTELVRKIRVPVQGHYGATDMNPKPDDVRAFYATLKETNPDGEFFIYEGAGHAFQDWTRPSFNADAARQAWSRTLAFFEKNLK